MNRIIRSLACALLLAPAAAPAQLLPLDVAVAGDTATVRVGAPQVPLLDLRLDFDEADGLTPASLGLDADLVATTSTSLLARLGSTQLSIPAALPVLLTVQPPMLGGLSFERRVHVEVHTHRLPYTAGSRFRLFKAPIDGAFRDITTAVEPGSVRTRGTTGGFSQFLVVYDLRPTDTVVAQKLAWLRGRLDLLPPGEAVPLRNRLDAIEGAVAVADWTTASTNIAAFRDRVTSRAGGQIPATWTAVGTGANHAGELLAGLDTLEFSVGYLRDFGP